MLTWLQLSLVPSELLLGRQSRDNRPAISFMATPLPALWHTAWDAAQPRLDALGHTPNRAFPVRPLRVGQLDSEQLDNELVTILRDPLTKCLNMIKVSYTCV